MGRAVCAAKYWAECGRCFTLRYYKLIIKGNKLNCEKCGADNLETAITCIKCGNSILGASIIDKPKPDSMTLWSPDKAALFSWFLFTPIFGTIIHAKNWRKLGESKKAKYSWFWAIGIFLIFNIAGAFAEVKHYNSDDINKLMALINIPITLVWYFVFGRSQSKFLMSRFKDGYTKRSWLVPFCISIIIIGSLFWLGTNEATDSQFVKY